MNTSLAGGKHRATELDLRLIVEFCETLTQSCTASQADFRQTYSELKPRYTVWIEDYQQFLTEV